MIRTLLVSAAILAATSSVSAQPRRSSEPGKYAYLEIRHEHQSPDLCLPTCIAMALDYFGEDHSQWTVKRLANEHADLYSGTRFEEVQEAVANLGYTWDRWVWRTNEEGFTNALRAVEQSLDDENPVIIGVASPRYNPAEPLRGHALLVYGYDEEQQEIMVMDPARQFPGKRYISFEDLRQMWKRGRRYEAMFTAPLGKLPTGHPRN
jgi:ABC-type bacteriocin/lantibiotic exporter with double-glycine peptidase domain